MNSPDLDVAGLRDDARTLKRALLTGDADAIARVLASHPKYAGRPPERLRPEAMRLPDAQATIAVEQGHATWSELLDAVATSSTGATPLRWEHRGEAALVRRGFDEARALDQSWCGPEHLLLAVLRPTEATAASRVLAEAGLAYESVRDRLQHRGYGPRQEGLRTNPAWHACIGMAAGIALAAGRDRVEDEHALAALLYSDVVDDVWESVDTTRAELWERCVSQGLPVPPVAPTDPVPVRGPMGPRVYYPTSEHDSVLRSMNAQVPRGVFWGWNTNAAGLCWVDAEDSVDLAAIVREIVTEPHAIEVVPWEEAVRRDDFNTEPTDGTPAR